jgi:hypothetical protein
MEHLTLYTINPSPDDGIELQMNVLALHLRLLYISNILK